MNKIPACRVTVARSERFNPQPGRHVTCGGQVQVEASSLCHMRRRAPRVERTNLELRQVEERHTRHNTVRYILFENFDKMLKINNRCPFHISMFYVLAYFWKHFYK